MRRLLVMLIVSVGWPALIPAARAQDTNACAVSPRTKLEAFETNTGTILIKGATQMGTVTGNSGVLSVRCKEITDTSTGRTEYGIAIEITQRGPFQETVLIDYDELDSLLRAIDYLNKVDWSVTSLAGFDANYATKGGFRIDAFGRQRSGVIEFSVRSVANTAPISLSRDQAAVQLRGLVEQAKEKLDSLRKDKPG